MRQSPSTAGATPVLKRLSERLDELDTQMEAVQRDRPGSTELPMLVAERELLVELLCLHSAELREREVPQRRPRLTAIDGGEEDR